MKRASLIAVLSLAAAVSAQDTDTSAWMPLFNGEDLSGWVGHPDIWRADSGMIIGSGRIPFGGNTFIWHDSSFTDFVLRVKGRMTWPEGNYANSGVHIRSEISYRPNYVLRGYQYEIGQTRWGHIRGEDCCGWGTPEGSTFYQPDSACLRSIRHMDWNDMEMRLDGTYMSSSLNGEFCGEKDDAQWYMDGLVGLQYHDPGNFEVAFKDIYIRPLNGSFSIPEGRQVYLGDDWTPVDRSAGENRVAGFRAAAVNGRLQISSALFREPGKTFSVTLSDMEGRQILQQRVLTAGQSVVFLTVPVRASGIVILKMDGEGRRFSAVLFSAGND